MVSTGERVSARRPAGGRGPGRGRGSRWASVLGVVLVLSVSGCAKDGGSAFSLPRAGSQAGPAAADPTSRAPTDPVPTTPSPATPASTVATATSDPAAPVVVAGRVTARRAGLSFEVPDGWQAIDPSSATRAGASVLPDSFRTLAEQ